MSSRELSEQIAYDLLEAEGMPRPGADVKTPKTPEQLKAGFEALIARQQQEG